ncbi:MAG TPA: TerC/Alx family metal homeostasis membrane protein [Bacteroidales bacterium]|nr:TerC/Alx family metal homeostasis membrane protein [Bacteroidales bacterium]HNZ41788.1 TerC/Alx family metal homeostasis membrane protein [Bacteroidales bacterium]HOH84599.1 TerC/Alx family metal homeostasis membrane protein [Bacteroidales bacterium]HPI29308.1 TerC/Alx family metal homeostasis membrane protein [Bacteroidales bacterium]HQP15471.1 TerC/Alx family metal homeostasis membrane protein [Bacteroidales bacterium]
MDPVMIYWIVFIGLFITVFIIDLYVTDHRKGALTVKTSLKWTGLWISIALLFGVSLYFFFPQNPDSAVKTAPVMMTKFIAGYLTEYSLSVDNLFVFIMIFSMMAVSQKNQPRLLKLGILISIALRILFILVGMELVEKFHWIIYVFGVILIWTAYKMAFSKEDDQVDPSKNILFKGASKLFPVDPDKDPHKFFNKINGKWHITSIFLVLLVIGSTDVLFAVDSIPAIIGVIKEGATNILTPEEENFIAITSNVFAVMGLISLFFALKGIIGLFRFLKHGVSFILLFIGAKMLLSAIPAVMGFFSNHSWVSLVVIIATLTLSILLSMLISEKKEIDQLKDEVDDLKENILN